MKNFHTMFFQKNHGFRKTLLIVRLSLILSVAFGLLNIATASAQSPQNKTYTIKCNDQKVESVFEQLEKLSGYNFLYQSSDIKNLKKVTYDFIKAPLTDIITYCLKESGLAFEIVNRQVVIFPETQEKKAKMPITVTGIVTNNRGEPLSGTNVLVKGTMKGTTTDLNGNFTIDVPEDAVLIIRFIGYKIKEVPVSARKAISVAMDEEVAELVEVAFISTGYQKILPEQSTGSLSVVRAKEFDTRVNTTDFLTGLQNKIPGLLINNDIKFEGNSLFQIRGISTINGNKQPLIVIDGYPTELSIDRINPNEIESVTVLKDAAAATIYGVRASNGVIVIERKKARAGKPYVVFRGTLSFNPKENYDRYRWDKDGANTIIEYCQENYKNSITSSTWDRLINPSTGRYYRYPVPGIIMAQKAAGVITQEEANQQFEELGSYNNAQDYSRLFLRTASTRTYNLDISGGNENVLYYITTNYTASDLSMINNDNSRFMLSGRTIVNLSKRFSLELTTDFQEGKTKSVPVPDINNIYPFERFKDDDGNPLSLYNGSNITPYYNDYLMSIGLLDNMYYPLKDINEISDKTHTINNRITANFRYNIGKGFNLNFGGVYESSLTDTKHLYNENSSEAHQNVNHYATENSEGTVFNIPKGGGLRQRTASRESYTFRAQLNYDRQINKNHSLNFIIGGEIREVLDKSNSSAYFGYNDQTLLHQPVNYTLFSFFSPVYVQNNSLSYSSLFSQGYTDNRYVSLYSNIVYSYLGKYSFTGSIRIDQSNLFGTDPKYHYKPLWSVGTAWNVHKENFMDNIYWVKSLKLRAAYGFNGNVAKNALPQVIAKAANYNFNSATIPILLLISYANSGLRWEQTNNFNIGIDYSILKNISGSLDYYEKKSIDLLATNKIDATQGGTSALKNQASIRNRGLEINLQADWITHKYFNWNTGLVSSYNVSKVLQVYNRYITPTSASNSYVSSNYADYLEGYAVGSMFSYRYAGVNSTGYPLIYDQDGQVKEFTYNGPKSDIEYSGCSIPALNVGLSNRLDIGNFYVYCMINYYGGFSVRIPMPSAGDVRPLEGASNYWRTPGDEEKTGMLPAINYRKYDTYLKTSDKFTVDGSYFTLGDLTASYSFRGSKLVRKAGISNLEIKLQASNLLTVGFNKCNYSVATGSYAKSYLTPTYTIGLYVNL